MHENFIISKNQYQQKIVIDPQDFVGQSIVSKGIYDATGLYFIEKTLAKLQNPIVFDIGANVGNHALRMSQYAKMVYLFEPQAQLIDCLQTTMALNHITNWKILGMGLSDENGTLPLYQKADGINCTNSFVADSKNILCAEETIVRIGDEAVTELDIHQLDFIKIDVEGFEAKVTAGLKKSIQQYRPIIFMEWDKDITKQQFREQKIFSTVFQRYIIKAVTRNPSESSLFRKICGKIQRVFTQKPRQRVIIGEFHEQLDYRHIVLVPEEKAYILE